MSVIIANKTYSSNEAAELLSMNVLTFQKFAREGKIRVYRVGKNYRVTGLALLDYIGIPIRTSSRKELVEELHNTLETLYPIFKAEGKDMAVFLHQAINLYADEESLDKLIADAKRFIELSQGK
jgi:excisionase family DNA binding protein